LTNLFDEIKALSTEQRNPASMNLDELDAASILKLINDEDAKVAEAVRKEIPAIERVVLRLKDILQNDGRLFYVGAGTSGRMGVIDAAECPPTFGSDPSKIQAIMAGGRDAVFKSQEGAEDREENGAVEMTQLKVGKNDMVIGIAASKRTPFVLGALKRSYELGAVTVLLTTNPRKSIDTSYLFEAICPEVGPEVLMGSTRMKSGLAQKMVLTMITTTVMVLLGKVFENMMVDLQLTNKKLIERAKRIIMIASDCTYDEAEAFLNKSNGHVKTAIIMAKRNISSEEARNLLTKSGEFVKKALFS
jgi:N-acetylmuramic acid 6-phosphate etherase